MSREPEPIQGGSIGKGLADPTATDDAFRISSDGWTLESGSDSWFQVVNTQSTWEGCKTTCAQIGGEMASIHSKKQHEFLVALTQNEGVDQVWIGLKIKGRYFLWPDGSRPEYKNWAVNQPNNWQNEQHCVEISHLFRWQWNDLDWYFFSTDWKE